MQKMQFKVSEIKAIRVKIVVAPRDLSPKGK